MTQACGIATPRATAINILSKLEQLLLKKAAYVGDDRRFSAGCCATMTEDFVTANLRDRSIRDCAISIFVIAFVKCKFITVVQFEMSISCSIQFHKRSFLLGEKMDECLQVVRCSGVPIDPFSPVFTTSRSRCDAILVIFLRKNWKYYLTTEFRNGSCRRGCHTDNPLQRVVLPKRSVNRVPVELKRP